jgi:hypothetical protein
VPARRRVEHDPAPERRRGPQNHSVSSRGDGGGGEAELREVPVAPDKTRIDLRGPVVHLQSHPVRDRLQLVQ